MRAPEQQRSVAPLTIVTSDELIESRENTVTPRFSNRTGFANNHNNTVMDDGDADAAEHDVAGECSEVDAYANPTELFQWLNYGNYEGAVQHIQQHPEEAKIWIVSRNNNNNHHQTSSSGKSPSRGGGTTTSSSGSIKWRYLPLHLVCLKPDAPEELLRMIVNAFPKAARKKDHSGNLPIHYLVAEAGRGHDIMKKSLRRLLEAFPESVHRRDRKGRSLTEIVSEKFNKGQLDKDTMLSLLSTIRQWKMGTSFDSSENNGQQQQQRRDGAPPKATTITATTPNNREVLFGLSALQQQQQDGQQQQQHLHSSDDRDRLIETAAVVTLTNQLTTTARELNSEKERIKRKSEKIHELRANIKGNGDRIKGLIHKLELYEEERESLANVSMENRALKVKMEALEKELEESEKRFQSKVKLQAKAQAMEAKLRSRIGMLEKELLELKTEKMQVEITKRICGDPKRVEEERDVLREMNESLQDHLNALKERCKDLEQDEEEKGELRSKLESAMGECGELNRRMSSLLEELEQTKSESFIHQSRLQTKIATLEKDLLEATAMLEAQAQAMDRPLTDLKLLEEDRNALQQVNQTLQEHVAALNDKCKTLEKSLHEQKEHMASEKLKDQAALSERQRELQSEFRSIASYLQNLMQVDPSKRGDAEYMRQVEQLRDIVGGGNNNNNNNNNNNSSSNNGNNSNNANGNGNGEVQRLMENLKRDRVRLVSENEDLRNEVRRLLETKEETDHAMASDLQRIAQKAEDYRQQLVDLKSKFEKLKTNNVGLRDIIAKNNSKYIAKVEVLGKDYKALQKANATLQEQLHELAIENRRIRDGFQGRVVGVGVGVGGGGHHHLVDKAGDSTLSSSRHPHHVITRHDDLDPILLSSTSSSTLQPTREQLLKFLANRKGQPSMTHQQHQQHQQQLQHQHQQQHQLPEVRVQSLKSVPSYRDSTPSRQHSRFDSTALEDRDDILEEVSALLNSHESRDVVLNGGLNFPAGSDFHAMLADHPDLRN